MELIHDKEVIKMSKLKTVLITGNNGFIGSYFVKKYNKKYNIIGLDKEEAFDKNVCAEQYIGDICNQELIQNIFENHDIDIVIHTAAEKSLIICENNKEDVYETNYCASIYLASIAARNNAKFIFLSSDQVFPGTSPFSLESTSVAPINYYGKLKTMVEAELIKTKTTAICRTALVFGDIPAEQISYFDSIKSSENLAVQGYIVQQTRHCLENGIKIVLPDDEYVSPTHVALLAEQLDQVICNDVSEILHCCGNDRISRYEMGIAIAEYYGYKTDTICSNGTRNPLRPKDVSLNCQKTEKLLKMKFPDFRSMLHMYM